MRRFEQVQLGELLQTLSVPITVPLVVGGSMATRDFFAGHHDLEAAQALGSPHIFMNILTTNGMVQRFIDHWTGPIGRMVELKIKLGAPNYPGDTLSLSGAVTDKLVSDQSVEITLKGSNSMGAHVTGTVRVHLP
jgi:hypothetical protein